MSRFVEGEDRRQATLLPSCLDDYVGEDNPARVIDAFVDELGLGSLGFAVTPAATGLPVRLLMTVDQASDKTAFPDLLAALAKTSVVVADRAYDRRAIIDLVAARGGEAHIPI